MYGPSFASIKDSELLEDVLYWWRTKAGDLTPLNIMKTKWIVNRVMAMMAEAHMRNCLIVVEDMVSKNNSQLAKSIDDLQSPYFVIIPSDDPEGRIELHWWISV